MPHRIQYQPVTGPVWRPPVAERLSWLPEGAPLPRALPGPPLVCRVVLEPIFVAPPAYDPAGLQWLPTGAPRAPDAERRVVERIVLDPFPLPPVVYDPAGMQWVLMGQPPTMAPTTGRGVVVLDPFPIPGALPPPEPGIPGVAGLGGTAERVISLGQVAHVSGHLTLPVLRLSLGARETRVRRRAAGAPLPRVHVAPARIPSVPARPAPAQRVVAAPLLPGQRPTHLVRLQWALAADDPALQVRTVSYVQVPQAQLEAMEKLPAFLLGAWWLMDN